MDRLIAFARARLKLEEPLILAGDYNVIPAPVDAKRPEAWVNDALFLKPTRDKFRTLINLGLVDALRAVSDDPGLFTYWDYQAGVDRHVRAWDKPSDHVPVYVDLDLG